MIGGTPFQKTGTAIRFLLNDAVAGSDGCGATGICGTEDCNDRKANRSGNVHRPGVVADEKMAPRKKCREFTN